MISTASETAGYRRMLKATSVIAGARFFTIAITVIRSKVLALLLGPAGMGAINLVTAAIEFTRVITGMGLDGATVRRIAEASSGTDSHALERAYRVASRTAMGIGAIAWIGISIASPWLSQNAFLTHSKYWLFILGGASLVFTPLLGVQLAFLQGLRLARMLGLCQILTSVAGAIITIVAVWLFGSYGGILVLLPIAGISLWIHHSFVARQRPANQERLDIDYRREIILNLKTGSGFAINAIWLTASAWLNLLFIRHHYGDHGAFYVGLYTAASTLANFYVGIILSSMSTEFYPALSAAGDDPPAMRSLLNQQTVLAIAIGVPSSLAALLMSPILLHLLYSQSFVDAAEVMRWLLAGMAMRFITCPLGFVLLARRATRLFFWSEVATGVTMILTSLFFLRTFGLPGLGIALISTNLAYLIGIAIAARRMEVYWSKRTFAVILETFAVVALCLFISLMLPAWQGIAAGVVIVACYAAHMLTLISKDSGLSLGMLWSKIQRRG